MVSLVFAVRVEPVARSALDCLFAQFLFFSKDFPLEILRLVVVGVLGVPG
jgi:hypothetical protein